MGKHLTLFETQEQYNMIADSLMHPNVTYIEKGNLIYNSIETVLICKFVTTEANKEVRLYYENPGGGTGSGSGSGADTGADTGAGSGDGSDSFNISKIISKIRIDGVENEINSTYTFTEVGEHIVEYEFANGVTKIPNKLFYYCEDMTEIRIPDIIKVIGNGVFDGCTNLQKIHIPNGVTSIGNYAFNHCLLNIYIPDSVTTIGEFCFANTSINKCTIGKSVTSIGANMFHYSLATELNIIIKAVNPPTVLQVISQQNADLMGELKDNVSIRIYVPDESVNLYRNAPGWDTYSEYIVSIKNY